MTTKKTQYNPPPPTELIVPKEEFIKGLQERIDMGEKILSFKVSTEAELNKNREEYYQWNDYNSEYLKQVFNNAYNEYKDRYDKCAMFVGFGKSRQTPSEKLDNFKGSISAKLTNLKNLYAKAELLKSSIENTEKAMVETPVEEKTTQIFIVHGHNDHVKIDVARTLEKLGLEPVILSEQPSQGQTVIEKFELHSNVGFAVVLLTGDDLGRIKTAVIDEDKYRARQNVILELGYFIGKLGRSNVFPMYEDGVEFPSDLHGIIYNSIDEAKTWKFKLVRELKAAGYKVDANNIL
jgi:predicted nucleotide-binding protein